MITKTKFIKFVGLKVSASRPDESQLDKINRFTRRKFTADEMYIGQLRLAHNAIDRDNERFSDEVLARFEKTIVRKTMLFDHAKYDAKNSAVGKFFDVQIETIPLDQAREMLGEELIMPVGVNEVKILAPWFYIPVKGVSEETIIKIDAGIYDFASIGFRAESLVPIRDANGTTLYNEYHGTGRMTEATEGSLVYLGAQGGMSIKTYTVGQASLPDIIKAPVTFVATTPADVSFAWDATAATNRLAKWASSDGSGDKDTMDWQKYRKGFAWYDTENQENFSAYKLPHHDIADGELIVIWNGCSAAMGAIMGARGGVNIPESDRDAVYNHLAKHYKQFDKEPPEKIYIPTNSMEGGSDMEKFLKMLSTMYGRNFTEENALDNIKALLDVKDAKILELQEQNKTVKTLDARVKLLEPLEQKVKDLEPLAADGKAYRDSLVSDYVSLKAKLAEVAETPEAQGKIKAVVERYPVDFLKEEVKHLQKRVEEKFPCDPQLKGDGRKDKSDVNAKNPLIPA